MRSIKAIVIGCIFIVVVILLLQLAYIFIAVGYNAMAADYPFLNDITGYIRYLVGLPIFVVTMFIGGYITASYTEMHSSIKVLVHCFAVGFITAGGMVFSTMENYNLSLTGIVVTILALVATSAGGFYWLRDEMSQSDTFN